MPTGKPGRGVRLAPSIGPMKPRRTGGVLAGLVVLLLAGNATALATGAGEEAREGDGPEVVTKVAAGLQAAPRKAPARSTVAGALIKSVGIYAAPGDGKPTRSLANPTESGAPLVFLVQETRADWLKVLLPVRPNGSTGWVKAKDVKTAQITFRIVVELRAHRITVYDGDSVFLSEPIGVGTRSTPTPGGLYYLKELLRPPNPNGDYGPYAYGLSGFSNQLTSFAGGEGVIGIHGTNNPASIGKDVSHGCIRMSNAGITRLAKRLPLGTPVEILA